MRKLYISLIRTAAWGGTTLLCILERRRGMTPLCKPWGPTCCSSVGEIQRRRELKLQEVIVGPGRDAISWIILARTVSWINMFNLYLTIRARIRLKASICSILHSEWQYCSKKFNKDNKLRHQVGRKLDFLCFVWSLCLLPCIMTVPIVSLVKPT